MTAHPGARRGVRIVGVGSYLPEHRLTNADLVRMMETSDAWIVQRTGIRERRVADLEGGETASTLATLALREALASAHLTPNDLDLIVCATMTAEMECPSCACLIANAIGASRAGAFDLNAACSGFVFGLNVAHELLRGGAYGTIGLIGVDTLSKFMRYNTAGRGTSIIFGDAAGAAVLKATDDASLGILAQTMHADGAGWKDIYVPHRNSDFPPGVTPDPTQCGFVQMSGASVFKFAVGTFPDLIQETLDKARLRPDDVDMYVCHQSNARILLAARERFGIPEEKLYINIDRVGNTVAASVPLCFDDLIKSGRVKPGMKVMFVAFGGGLTWGSSLWQI
ncbi:3-oxoacyl-[acyl-carrier-protein] synthase III [Phycisphaerales bacterium]|nr:3-oxoacyl-[acyl-carrier-protein] synthase III [Phycisphaerales bacterium]